jgi:hypothetical protein
MIWQSRLAKICRFHCPIFALLMIQAVADVFKNCNFTFSIDLVAIHPTAYSPSCKCLRPKIKIQTDKIMYRKTALSGGIL